MTRKVGKVGERSTTLANEKHVKINLSEINVFQVWNTFHFINLQHGPSSTDEQSDEETVAEKCKRRSKPDIAAQ